MFLPTGFYKPLVKMKVWNIVLNLQGERLPGLQGKVDQLGSVLSTAGIRGRGKQGFPQRASVPAWCLWRLADLRRGRPLLYGENIFYILIDFQGLGSQTAVGRKENGCCIWT